ncbi:MAG: hypothetical protein LBP86_08850 [Azoarcus sp.]|jgi:hypothetical protein|nr:hypothetical protein [Azoarcus sp.]
MIFPRRTSIRLLVPLVMLPFVVACENSATAMLIDGKDHALTLVREQPYFWQDEVRQYIVASRLPRCQRRVSLHPDRADMVPIDVYEAGNLLWALHQGERWYLVSTGECRVQDWDNTGGQLPGPAVGRFEAHAGAIVFTPAPAPPSPEPPLQQGADPAG